jgi:hypothetical protein
MSLHPSGLVLLRGRLLYGWKHGFGCGWLPHVIQQAIVTAWNYVACLCLGHGISLPVGYENMGAEELETYSGPMHCCMCCRDYLDTSLGA